MSQLVGQSLGHYRIVELIGAGGMGEVYRARDKRLDRDVAIKVLPAAVAHEPARLERFEREARAVARLAHPNILEIWDFGSEGGVTYAVTELLEGQTLRERVPTSGLPWQKVAEIGSAIADGLAAAHAKDVVHRDLKPENVFVTSDGRVKILDFGLAAIREQVLSEAETGTLTPAGTLPGTVMGTLGYMSPEQLRGEPADARSDIFALGCVLYEMVSGRRAFSGATAAETMAAILKEEPQRLSSTGASLPVELESTIHRCLEKSPEARFQSAADLAYSLRAIGTGPAVATAPPTAEAKPPHRRVKPWLAAAAAAVAIALIAGSIWLRRGEEEAPPAAPEVGPNRVAVVPLENRTGDHTLDPLGFMAADLIVQRFTETAAAEVVPLTDALEELPPSTTGGRQAPAWSRILELARQRGAGMVLGGAYYLDGSALRLQARLVDAANGDLIRAFEPVSAAREEAATSIGTLRERVVAAVAAHRDLTIDITIMTPPATFEAYQAFQRGQAVYSDWEAAAPHYRRALEEDPHFHRARLWLGWALLGIGDEPGIEAQLSVLEGQLDRMTPFEEINVRYLRSVLEWDRLNSLRLIRRVRELAPGMQLAGDEAFRLLELNRPRQAAEFLEDYRVPEGSPFSWWPLVHTTAALHMLGEYQTELEAADQGLERFPGVAQFFFAQARALAAMGRASAVNQVIDDYLRVQTEGGSAGALMSATAMELGAHGYRQQADAMATRSVRWFETHPAVLSKQASAPAIELWSLGNPEERRSYATALCMVGRWRDAGGVMAGLIESGTGRYQLRGWPGMIAARTGDAATARQISDSLPVKGSPRASGWGTYWQAAIAAHLGEHDRAVELLAEAFSKGFPYGVYLHSALEFEPLWDDPPFQELIAPKG